MLQEHFTKIIKQNNTLSVSEGGLEESCRDIESVSDIRQLDK